MDGLFIIVAVIALGIFTLSLILLRKKIRWIGILLNNSFVLPFILLLIIGLTTIWVWIYTNASGLTAWIGILGQTTAIMTIYITTRNFRMSSRQQEQRFSEESRLRVMPCLILECLRGIGSPPNYVEMTLRAESVSEYPAFAVEFFVWHTAETSRFSCVDYRKQKEKISFPTKTFVKGKSFEIKYAPPKKELTDDTILIVIAEYKDSFMNPYAQMFKQERKEALHFIAFPPQLINAEEKDVMNQKLTSR